MPPLVSQSRSMPIAARCGTYRSEPYHLRGQQFAAINFAFERARNAAMRMDFQTTRQMLIAKVYPIWCYEERVPRRLARHFSSATWWFLRFCLLGFWFDLGYCSFLGCFRISVFAWRYMKMA